MLRSKPECSERLLVIVDSYIISLTISSLLPKMAMFLHV